MNLLQPLKVAAVCLLIFPSSYLLSSGIDDPTSYLSFDNIVGSEIPNVSIGPNGEIVGEVSIEEGKIGSAIRLGSREARINFGSFNLNPEEFSVSCWFKADSFDNRNARIISKANGSNSRDHVWMLSTFRIGNKVRLGALVSVDGRDVQLVAAREFLVPQIWYHVVLIFDGSEIRLYLDGEKISRRRRSGMVDSSSAPVAIGNEAGSGDRWQFDGWIDEMRIYDRALSDIEVSELLSYDGYMPPIARFESSPEEKTAGSSVQFDGSASIQQTELITEYSWDFGDETPIQSSGSATIEHVFSVAGVYVVTLTVIDNVGVESSYAETVSVSPREETDPIFSSSTAASITSNDLVNWNESHSWGNHALAGYLTEEEDSDSTNELIAKVSFDGAILSVEEAGEFWNADLSSLASDGDSSPVNELNQSILLDGTVISITDAGGSLSQDLSSLIPVPSYLGSPDGLIQHVVQVDPSGSIALNSITEVGGLLPFSPNEELLVINGSVALGDYGDVENSNPRPGALRFNGVDLLGFVSDESGLFTWRSLTATELEEEDPMFSESPASGITEEQIVTWDTPFVESDPLFVASVASGITAEQLTNWSSAFSWGDHSVAGYLSSESDPLFVGSPASGITEEQIATWDTPFVESDPLFTASVASGITAEQLTNWSSAFSWGDHNAAGYLTTEIDDSIENEIITSFALVGGVLEVSEAGHAFTVDLSELAVVDDADADPLNETNSSLELDGTLLSLTDVAGTLSIDLSGIIPSPSSLSSPDGDMVAAVEVSNSGNVFVKKAVVVGSESPPDGDEALHVVGDVVIEGEVQISGLVRHGDVFMGQFGRFGDQSSSDDI